MNAKILNFVKPMLERTKEFVEVDMGISIKSFSPLENLQENVKLQKNIAMIGVSGSSKFMIAIGYDDQLIKKLTEVFLDGVTLEECERFEAYESIATEIANTVIGNSLPEDENRLNITPPVFIREAKSISGDKSSSTLISNIDTQYGQLSLIVIF